MIKVKRIYEEPADDDGYRVLVDRLWPRGVARQDAALDEWCKSITPSNELRKWFHEETCGRWREFCSKYKEELCKADEDLDRLAEIASDSGLTLLTAAKNRQRNHALVLKEVLSGEG
ncbi:MAG: DUF488 domain-containing protein [Gammaproteobacteria bacterium HGW-Gammaproteobacteria-8]|nr:MAG: DUF488 domain-containing protein [Gammaproteobacteria bacterium HGW-Gammaproteobacteria-8]